MNLTQLYKLKLYEYKETGLRERPEKLLAMLMLPEKDKYTVINLSLGDFYQMHQKEIDEKIKKIENDFNFTKEDITKIIENKAVCYNYEKQKIWFAYCDGFRVVYQSNISRKNNNPEEIYSGYFYDNQLKEQNNIENLAIANDIKIQKLDDLINKIISSPSSFYTQIEELLSPEERMFITKNLINKSCLNCTNGCCNIETYEKIGLNKYGKPEGSECLGWYNPELIGKSKILKINDINKLTYNN